MSAADHVHLVNKYTNEILELMYSQDDYTTSDLQGMVSAIVLIIIYDCKKSIGVSTYEQINNICKKR